MAKKSKKSTIDKKLAFNVFGGPYDGETLFWPPPFTPIQAEKVLPSLIGDGTWHKYVFSRIDWTAKYVGVAVKRDGQVIQHEEK